MALSKLNSSPFNGGLPGSNLLTGLTESAAALGVGAVTGASSAVALEKENNKNNLLLAMLWLQRHREIINLSQQNEVSPASSNQVSPALNKVKDSR